jgi:two-component system response regulator HydG
MMVDGPTIDISDLPAPIRNPTIIAKPDDTLITFEELQKRHLVRVLDRVGGKKARAAEILGISRSRVYEMLAEMNTKSGG